MNGREMEHVRAAFKALVEAVKEEAYNSRLALHGSVATHMIVASSLLESGAMNRDVLTQHVQSALAALTDDMKATEFPYALNQLAGLLGLKVDSPKTPDQAAWDELNALIERLQRP